MLGGPLLCRPVYEHDESFIGYLLRTAEANGYPNLSWITGTGSIAQFLAAPQDRLSAMSTLFGEEWKALFERSYRPRLNYPRGRLEIGGQPIPKYALRILSPTLCPPSSSHDPYA